MMAILAHELLLGNEFPRNLRCRSLTLAQIANENGMVLDGHDGEIQRFTTLSDLAATGGIAVTYLNSLRFAKLLRSGDDIAVVTRPELREHLQAGNIALIAKEDPHDVFYTAFAAAVEGKKFEMIKPFVSPTARIHQTAVIADNVHIEAGAVIGACSVVLPNTYVGVDVVIKPNATVGGDGFENAIIRGRRAIVPHAGGVWLSEGAQVGSSTCIDRGLFGNFSFIGAHTTIDNLVHFAHSARTGKNCSLVACSEVSGAVVLGDGVWLGPNVSVNQSLTVGDHCYVGTGAVVTRNLPPHSLAYGSPAKAMAQVCVCRAKLQFENGRATCGTCGKTYRLSEAGEVHRV
jgi:UDP-3-O-[3-hydroxymyristoyl] glucosamine N-acyltransferase